MKRTVLVLGLLLAAVLLFAEISVGPADGSPQSGNLTRSQLRTESQLQIQDPLEAFLRYALMAQARIRFRSNSEPAAASLAEGTTQNRARTGDCDSSCDGEPDRTQDRLQLHDGSCHDEGATEAVAATGTTEGDQLKDGSCGGEPTKDQDRTRVGKPNDSGAV